MKNKRKIKDSSKILRNSIIGIGIFILTMFVVVYGISTIYPKPEYDDFCGRGIYTITTETECIDNGGVWINENYVPKINPDNPQMPIQRDTFTCQAPIKCYDDLDRALEKRSRSVFLIAIPLGILIIALGAFVFHLDSVGLGLMFGGIGTLIYGAGGYWRYSDNFFKFIISLIGLGILIFLAYWFNKRINKKK